MTLQLRFFTIFSRNHAHTLSACIGMVVSSAVASSLASNAISPSAGDVMDAFNTLGLNPESLAALDVVESEPSLALDRLTDEYETYEQLLSLQADIVDNQKMVYTANAILRDQADDTEAQQALDQAETQITLLSSLAHDTKINLINTLLDGLADTQMIEPVLYSQGLIRFLPPAYRIAVDTAAEAKELSWALKMQEIAEANGTELSSEANQTIQLALGHYDVQNALLRVTINEQPNQLTMTQWVLTH